MRTPHPAPLVVWLLSLATAGAALNTACGGSEDPAPDAGAADTSDTAGADVPFDGSDVSDTQTEPDAQTDPEPADSSGDVGPDGPPDDSSGDVSDTGPSDADETDDHTPDGGLDGDDGGAHDTTESDTTEPDAALGCPGEGEPCGTCGTGVWRCLNATEGVCDGDEGETALDACGGCTDLDGVPGERCLDCGDDDCTWICAATDLQCFNPPDGFVAVPAGGFYMGSPRTENPRYEGEIRHPVVLTRPFLIGVAPVTQREWYEVMGSEPSWFDECGTDCPVESVSWWETLLYANALSRAAGLEECYDVRGCGPIGTGCEGQMFAYCYLEGCEEVVVTALDGNPYNCEGYRLPTSAEWEYAARAGTTAATWAGELGDWEECLSELLTDVAWYCGNSDSVVHPVGLLRPNPWGLHDMLGNVSQWVWDAQDGYTPDEITDPLGGVFNPSLGRRVRRGANWGSTADTARSAAYDSDPPDMRSWTHGFRVARTILPVAPLPD